MTHPIFQKRRLPWLIAAAVCFVLAAFFAFALIGYKYIALLLAGMGTVILLYLFLPRKLKIVLTVLLCAGTTLFIAAEVPVVLAARGDADVDADYLIVLGAGVNGTVPSLSLRDRLDAAAAYLQEHPDCVAIVSGGQGPGEDITEAEAMAGALLAAGISADRIWLEDQATSTEENLRFSFALIGDTTGQTVAVLSSEYHLCRAKLLAQRQGLPTVYGVPARTTKPIMRLGYFIREAFGMAYIWVFG